MKIKKQFFATLLGLLFSGIAMFAQDAGDEYAREIMKRVKKGEITMAEIEAKLESGEIKRMGGTYMNPKASIISNMSRSNQHVILSEAIVATSLKDKLNGKEDAEARYTVFAPYDESFGSLPDGYLAEVTSEGNEEKLEALAGNHIIEGDYTMDRIISAIDKTKYKVLNLTTVSGMKIQIFKRGARYVVSDENGIRGKIRVPDISTSNGTIHGIDAVLQKKKAGLTKKIKRRTRTN